MALHALAYCERLFYLEEVEELRVADARVYAGRTLHTRLDEAGDFVEMVHESESLGLRGKLDALKARSGALIPYEHKRGRCFRRAEGSAGAWPSDRLQLGAYALLVEDAMGSTVEEGRIRYHADNVLVHVPIDEELRASVVAAVERARELTERKIRPSITTEESKCTHCSLAPICLPEETRRVLGQRRKARRLFPKDDERVPLHVFGHRSRVGRSAHELMIRDEDATQRVSIRGVRSVTIHGHARITAQALRLCADHGVAVHWVGRGGWYQGTFWRDEAAVQRRIRQYEALREPGFRLKLSRRLVAARVEGQLRYVLRATRGSRSAEIQRLVAQWRRLLPQIWKKESPDSLRGLEGLAARLYMIALRSILSRGADERLVPGARTRRPPRDRFNALLGYCYGLLLREVTHAVRCVGLDGAFGFYHRPRSAAPPLALDLMELFRVSVVDVALVGAVNRRQFDPDSDFRIVGQQVWLSRSARKTCVDVIERRLADSWRHPVLRYSLSYRRHIELEVRLLEKEWSGEPGLFARARIR